ncbi:hypothetical protein [Nonomuraea sp. NPDC005650]|uniref:hypothetical protein n=1 Tax=Nonomuraea sp. NPDC005650 TaxID=3157045 RepID=UPI0033A4E368
MAKSAFFIAVVMLAGTVTLREGVELYLSRRRRSPGAAPVHLSPCCGPSRLGRFGGGPIDPHGRTARLRRGRRPRCACEGARGCRTKS